MSHVVYSGSRIDDFDRMAESKENVRDRAGRHVGYALPMQVRVLYFGVLKEVLKRDGEQLELPSAASVGTLLSTVKGRQPGASDVWKSMAVAVNREYADLNWTLHEGDEVALLPPVSGGWGRTR